MIDYIKGELTELTPAIAVLETNGVGYELNISINTYTALSNAKTAKLYVHESIREDAHVLFGFWEKQERVLFRQLISVSGVGPSTGRIILSSITPAELISAISQEDLKVLKMIKGIGAKTAQRLIVELKDKVQLVEGVELVARNSTSAQSEEAIAALVMLGFAQKPTEKVVAQIIKENSSATVEQIIKTALKLL